MSERGCISRYDAWQEIEMEKAVKEKKGWNEYLIQNSVPVATEKFWAIMYAVNWCTRSSLDLFWRPMGFGTDAVQKWIISNL